MKREHDETFYEWKKQVLINSHQPERLSPEDQLYGISGQLICDSLNTTNK